MALTDVNGANGDGKSVVKLPLAGTFKYLISVDSNVVPTPNVGDATPGWKSVLANDEITVANGKNVGVAEVDAVGKVVKFVNVVAVNVDHIAAISGQYIGAVAFIDDAAVVTAVGGTAKLFTVEIDGAAIVTVSVEETVATKSDLLALINVAIGLTGTASYNASSNKIVIQSATTGTASKVAIGGTNAGIFFGEGIATNGTLASN